MTDALQQCTVITLVQPPQGAQLTYALSQGSADTIVASLTISGVTAIKNPQINIRFNSALCITDLSNIPMLSSLVTSGLTTTLPFSVVTYD